MTRAVQREDWRAIALTVLPPVAVDALAARHQEPHRRYHDESHLNAVVRGFVDVDADSLWQRPREALLALLFHDAVYVPGRSDNEDRSTQLAQDTLRVHGVDADAARVGALILLTAKHGKLSAEDVDSDAALVLDIDVAVLGADAAAYDRYAQGVAAEFAPVVGADAYGVGRVAFIDAALQAPRLFLSERFAALEAPARKNLMRERARLS
jgi:predicted metal-dependent HD superfamily phosphohydrolase